MALSALDLMNLGIGDGGPGKGIPAAQADMTQVKTPDPVAAKLAAMLTAAHSHSRRLLATEGDADRLANDPSLLKGAVGWDAFIGGRLQNPNTFGASDRAHRDQQLYAAADDQQAKERALSAYKRNRTSPGGGTP